MPEFYASEYGRVSGNVLRYRIYVSLENLGGLVGVLLAVLRLYVL